MSTQISTNLGVSSEATDKSADHAVDKAGLWMALGAYGSWGLFPIFWHFLKGTAATEILFHRVLWSWVFYTVLIGYQHRRFELFPKLSFAEFKRLSLAAVLLMGNWLVYIWAVNSGHIVDSSLGYFINPFMNFILGVFFFKEKLNHLQKAAIAIAAVGVIIIGFSVGAPPWIALFLAVTFGLYGFQKKQTKTHGLSSNQFESLIMVPVGIFILLLGARDASLTFLSEGHFNKSLLLIAGGVVTGIPLLFFAGATKRLPMFVLGFFQYLSPTLQFLTGVLIFHEVVSPLKWLGFSLIWLSLGMVITHQLTKTKSV